MDILHPALCIPAHKLYCFTSGVPCKSEMLAATAETVFTTSDAGGKLLSDECDHLLWCLHLAATKYADLKATMGLPIPAIEIERWREFLRQA